MTLKQKHKSPRPYFVLLTLIFLAMPASADQEASNVPHVASGSYGRCYAKSIPAHIYDPRDQVRQQGVTRIYQVGLEEDTLIEEYKWFGQKIYLDCVGNSTPTIVRLGPWHRGHDASEDHLALAFYRGGQLVKKYSTLDISGGELNTEPSFSKYKNVSASVSHYTVFKEYPKLVTITHQDGSNFHQEQVIKAVTIDNRELIFNLSTGLIR